MTDRTRPHCVVVNVHTNDQMPPDLLELAAVPIVGWAIGQPDEWIVHPDRPITPAATMVHGITNEEVEYTDTFPDIATSVLAALNAADVLVAHDARPQVDVLQRALGHDWTCPRVVDSLTLARRRLPERDNHELSALAQAFTLDTELPDDAIQNRATHNALVTARLVVHLATAHLLEHQTCGSNSAPAPAAKPSGCSG
jgi:DNA polymerase III epsilon subunit-like protein